MKRVYLVFVLLSCMICGKLFAQTEETYQLSTHILDIHLGKPASGVTIILFKYNTETSAFEIIDMGKTDENGRVNQFLPAGVNNEGAYKLQFDTLPYFTNQGIESIYPAIEVLFQIKDQTHYHIPITVSANGYSTYRGS
ncbi:MAG: hydroxyisourate hydrolase [Tannerellaceae bacterium]|nr:hydroxyisourate hydrolase [Tannerellaceae bacterium]